MTEFEKELLKIQKQLLKVQEERNEILKDAFVIYPNTPSALEKIAMELEKIKYTLNNGV